MAASVSVLPVLLAVLVISDAAQDTDLYDNSPHAGRNVRHMGKPKPLVYGRDTDDGLQKRFGVPTSDLSWERDADGGLRLTKRGWWDDVKTSVSNWAGQAYSAVENWAYDQLHVPSEFRGRKRAN